MFDFDSFFRHPVSKLALCFSMAAFKSVSEAQLGSAGVVGQNNGQATFSLVGVSSVNHVLPSWATENKDMFVHLIERLGGCWGLMSCA